MTHLPLTVQFEPTHRLPLNQPRLMWVTIHNTGSNPWFALHGRLRAGHGVMLLSNDRIRFSHSIAAGEKVVHSFWVQGLRPGAAWLSLERLRIQTRGQMELIGSPFRQNVEVLAEDPRRDEVLVLCVPRWLYARDWARLEVHLFNTSTQNLRLRLQDMRLENGRLHLHEHRAELDFILPPGKYKVLPLSAFVDDIGLPETWLRIAINVFPLETQTPKRQVVSIPLQIRPPARSQDRSGPVIYVHQHNVHIEDIVQTGKGNVLFGDGSVFEKSAKPEISLQDIVQTGQGHAVLGEFSPQWIAEMLNSGQGAIGRPS